MTVKIKVKRALGYAIETIGGVMDTAGIILMVPGVVMHRAGEFVGKAGVKYAEKAKQNETEINIEIGKARA